jgi:ankyrin repeat protein
MSSGTLFKLFYGDDVAGAAALLSRDGLQMGSTTAGPARDTTGPRLSKQEINKRDPQGRTVLHLSASKGSLEFVKALLENLATDVNLLDIESGWYRQSLRD